MVLLFPICCAAPLSKEIMDRFIRENDVDDDDWQMVFVDCLDNYYDEESMIPMEADGNPNSPFIGKTPQECHQLLLKLKEDTESKIMTNYFAVMDERSKMDDTVLLVNVRPPGEENDDYEYATVRASFQASAQALILYSVGKSSIEEDAERAAREKDNVFRGNW